MSVGYLVQALLCLKMHQIAPKMQHTETENLKKILGRGLCTLPRPFPIGEGDTPPQTQNQFFEFDLIHYGIG